MSSSWHASTGLPPPTVVHGGGSPPTSSSYVGGVYPPNAVVHGGGLPPPAAQPPNPPATHTLAGRFMLARGYSTALEQDTQRRRRRKLGGVYPPQPYVVIPDLPRSTPLTSSSYLGGGLPPPIVRRTGSNWLTPVYPPPCNCTPYA